MLNTHNITFKVVYSNSLSPRIYNPVFAYAIILVVVEFTYIIIGRIVSSCG